MTNKLHFKQALKIGVLTASVSTLINVIIYSVAHASGILRDDVFVKPGTPLTIAPVILFSILPPIIGAIIFFLFEKYTKNGFRNFTIFGTIIFILMLIPPFQIKDVPFNYALTLEIMHLVVFALLLYFIRRSKKGMLQDKKI